MQAFFIRRYGGPAVLEAGELPPPPLGPNDVRIAVHAASVNPVDWKVREGKLKVLLPYRFPLVLGHDCSGVVREVGAGVETFRPGDAVYARLDKGRLGAFADEAVMAASNVAPKPARLSHAEAASLPLVALTAWQALVDVAKVQRGQTVLVHAGAGGVGSAAVQLARHLGAKVVATASASNLERVRSFGADTVVDYHAQRFDDVVRDVDAVIDGVGQENVLRSFRCVRPGGIVISIADAPDLAFAREYGVTPALWPVFWLMGAKVNHAARRHHAKYRYWFMHPDGAQLRQLGTLVDQGVLRPHVDRVFPFSQTKEAVAYAEGGKARGKVVVSLRD
ncbi:NADP-dependent oxidoreductase [Pyxidicoccus trucidator]|uniref:NADP-dependent oxidoreductase n=1 Tax=Pyxidicoccus trucidator TaxID=2709662 RepID=UPI0013DCAE85|nr:NADP-dependent oxidoreductase [Pyxidicoccus trucidator]